MHGYCTNALFRICTPCSLYSQAIKDWLLTDSSSVMYRHQLIIQTQGHSDPLSLCKSYSQTVGHSCSTPYWSLFSLITCTGISYSHTTSYFYSIPPLLAPPHNYLLAIGLLLAYHGVFLFHPFLLPSPYLLSWGFFCFKLPSPLI